MDNYKLIAGDRTIEVTPQALEDFVGIIINGDLSQKLDDGTSEVSSFWHELRTLTPAYAGGSNN